MDDIFFYILVIIIIIIIIIVLYNYNKNIEKFDDLPYLGCYIFSDQRNDILGDFPRECRKVNSNKYTYNITIPNNKGELGDTGETLSPINVNVNPKCYNCTPINTKNKEKIVNIHNGTKDINIEPSIKINHIINTENIIFKGVGSKDDIKINNQTNLSKLKKLTSLNKKCRTDEYNTNTDILSSLSSIGECKTCRPCGENKYSTCGGPNNILGECLECTTCPNGQYLDGCRDRQQGTCVDKSCICNNGEASNGTQCPNQRDEHCQSCDINYQLVNNTCVKCEPEKPANSSYNRDSCDWYCNDGYDNINGECLIKCPSGQKRNSNNTCEPCGEDYYKTGENTDTECTPCSPMSTTSNNDDVAISEDDCKAKPGYIKEGGKYRLLKGYRERSPESGHIVGCEYNYNYKYEDVDVDGQDITSQCVPCEDLGIKGYYDQNETPNDCSNIVCNSLYELNPDKTDCVKKECVGTYLDSSGVCRDSSYFGDGVTIVDTNTLKLSKNHSWDGSKDDGLNATKCPLGQKRDSDENIIRTNFNNNINCESCQDIIEYNKTYAPGYNGTSNNCNTTCFPGYELDSRNNCLKICDAGEIRNSRNECEECPADTYKDQANTDTSCNVCPEGYTTNGEKGKTNINECLIKCDEGYYRNGNNCEPCEVNKYKDQANTDTSCKDCPKTHTTNGETGSKECKYMACSSNTYYDPYYCPENSYYDEKIRLCVCQEGFELNDSGDGCERKCNYQYNSEDPNSFFYKNHYRQADLGEGDNCVNDNDCRYTNLGTRCIDNKCRGRRAGDFCNQKNPQNFYYCMKCPCGYERIDDGRFKYYCKDPEKERCEDRGFKWCPDNSKNSRCVNTHIKCN